MAISQQPIIRSTSGLILGCTVIIGVGRFNSAIYIYDHLTLVVMATKFGTNKKGYNSAYVRNICAIFASVGRRLGLGYRMLPIKFYPN